MKINSIFSVISISAVLIASAALISSAPSIKETQADKKWEVTIDKIPKTLDEFKAMRDKLASSPQGGIVVYLVGHLIMTANPELGEQCLIIALDKGQLAQAGSGSKAVSVEGWVIGSSEKYKLTISTFARSKAYVAKSYVAGTSTAAGYKLPPLPYKYIISRHSYQDADPNIWKGMVNTSCNDGGYVPIHVKVNSKGVWKVSNSSSFYSGCKPPVVNDDDDL
jgi:hypothetical protein